MSQRRGTIQITIQILLMLVVVTGTGARLSAMQNSEEVHDQYRYRTMYVETPPTIDGDLSDAVWERAEVIDMLVQQTPIFGDPASERTEVRVVYDSEAIYVAAYCYDTPFM
jgi:hypothetical protein